MIPKHLALLALLLAASLTLRAQVPAPVAMRTQNPAPAAPQPTNAPSAPTYTVSPGDVLDLNFRWTPEFNQTITVQPDGNAIVNAAGPQQIHLAGLTLDRLHDELVARTSSRLINPEITITLHDVDRPHVLVGGEVVNPGRVDLRHATTAFEAIFLAGGAKESSSMAHVVVFRRVNSEYSEVIKLDFHNYDSGLKPTKDIQLQPGDMVLVPRDALTKIGRFVRTLNVGAYFSFNPLGTNGFF